MTRQILLLLLLALTASAGQPPTGRPVPAGEFIRLPPWKRPGYVEPPARNFSTRPTKAKGRASDVYPNWTPLACDGSKDDQSPKSPRQEDIQRPSLMLINTDYLYFFYDSFVVCMQKPVLEKLFTNNVFEKENKDVQLLTSRPVYAMHWDKSESEELKFLTSSRGFSKVKLGYHGSMEYVAYDGKTTILILENSDSDSEPEFYTVDFRQNWYGQLSQHGMTASNHRRARNEKGFVRYDYVKWFEIVYNTELKSMKFYYWHPEKEVWLGEPAQRSQSYLTDSFVYWDRHIEPKKAYSDHWFFNLWLAGMVELDVDNKVHIHTYVFKISEAEGYLTIAAHHEWSLDLIDLLDCRPKDFDYPVLRREQLKGIVFLINKSHQDKVWTLVFIDQFYYAVNADLMNFNFFLRNDGIEKKASKVEFEADVSDVTIDLVSTKYVKHIVKNQNADLLFAFEKERTYEMMSDFDQVIKLKQTDQKISACSHATLTLLAPSTYTFCIEKQEYYLLSTDESFKSLKEPPAHRISIQSIFAESNVYLSGEDVEYVFNYGEKIVFMTYNHLLSFKRELFKVVDQPFGAIIKMSANGTLDQNFSQVDNCLWTRCTSFLKRSLASNHSRSSS